MNTNKKLFKLGYPVSWSCKICEMINDDDLVPKCYERLRDWYSRENQCGTQPSRLRGIMHRSGVLHPYTDEYYWYLRVRQNVGENFMVFWSLVTA